ncbi:MAG: hypothetical protein A3C90_00400 [Candidatus Magasanikbacteria bacterium RIFCSPHIGHO2_02_FULL_51_14]|uniref:DUF3592 domain-containing protein n=1 Tax=Candidatus Magasanikbacteria bacterium RIFCSPHIGHO2_02_FULL_51_14 TaxID=1798683 RepID=A0A1F6ME63_9BACT|nr:MAG: hypothetical protein A3C90_00400 [Candidatus Magasanikbacteria bacterium RIFCSPHIGHO2_02_FULL_51_14]
MNKEATTKGKIIILIIIAAVFFPVLFLMYMQGRRFVSILVLLLVLFVIYLIGRGIRLELNQKVLKEGGRGRQIIAKVTKVYPHHQMGAELQEKLAKHQELVTTGLKAVSFAAKIYGFKSSARNIRDEREEKMPSWSLAAEWTDDATGKSYRFISQPVYVDPSQYLQKTGNTIQVYIDPLRPKKYWVDISSLTTDKL